MKFQKIQTLIELKADLCDLYELQHENISPETNGPVQSQKKARSLKLCVQVVEESYCVAKTKALISCTVTIQVICAFVFA